MKLRKRRRFKTVAELEAFFSDKDVVAGLEYSYAEKCKIIREQIQLRKKLDCITKIGDTNMHNCSDTKAHPEPLPTLWKFFEMMCTREKHHGIPPPKAPELMERRASKPGDDSLATVLLKRQHEQAAALTHAFYSSYSVHEEGEFVAYKMVRTLVQKPESYIGLAVSRKFDDGVVYKGKIISYYDHKQFWQVEYPCDGQQEDWAVREMKKWVSGFVCGPIIDGVTERTADAQRTRIRERRKHGRRNPVQDVSHEVMRIQAAVESGLEFELPDGHDECAGTVWKLLRTYVEIADGAEAKLGAYMPSDEATSIDPDDLRNLTANELQDSYDVEIAPLEHIEAWIRQSAITKVAVETSPNRRRSPRVLCLVQRPCTCLISYRTAHVRLLSTI